MIAYQSQVEGFIHDVSEKVDLIEERVDSILQTLNLEHRPHLLKGLSVDSSSSLARLQRALFNTHSKMQGEENAIIEKIESMPPNLQDHFVLTQQLRDSAASAQLYFEDAKHLLETNVVKKITQVNLNLHAECSAISSELSEIFFILPTTGTSLHAWLQNTPEQMRNNRPAGRPATPSEVNIQRWRRDVSQLLTMIRQVTGNPDMTLKEAMPVEKIGPGRPRLSKLGVMDRRLVAMYIKQQKLNEKSQTDDTREKLKELNLKIADMEQKIFDAESILPLTELLIRDLEKLRNTHRELTVYEPVSIGYEQDSIRLMLMENEAQQQRLVAQILARDSTKNISLNHRVNPSARLKRFNQVIRSKNLSPAQKAKARQLNKELTSFPGYRKRYNKD